MKDSQTIDRFIELRAQNWSFNPIAAELNVHKNTESQTLAPHTQPASVQNCAGTFSSCFRHDSPSAAKSFRNNNLQSTMPAKLCHAISHFGLVLAHFPFGLRRVGPHSGSPAIVKARIRSGASWSGLTTGIFNTPQDLTRLGVTEIMYQPTVYAPWTADDLEFLCPGGDRPGRPGQLSQD